MMFNSKIKGAAAVTGIAAFLGMAGLALTIQPAAAQSTHSVGGAGATVTQVPAAPTSLVVDAQPKVKAEPYGGQKTPG